MTDTQPRFKRMAPRAENLLRYINDSIIYNLKLGATEFKIWAPSLLNRAFAIVNETGTLIVRDYDASTQFKDKQ
jgi:hypothetical protein